MTWKAGKSLATLLSWRNNRNIEEASCVTCLPFKEHTHTHTKVALHFARLHKHRPHPRRPEKKQSNWEHVTTKRQLGSRNCRLIVSCVSRDNRLRTYSTSSDAHVCVCHVCLCGKLLIYAVSHKLAAQNYEKTSAAAVIVTEKHVKEKGNGKLSVRMSQKGPK